MASPPARPALLVTVRIGMLHTMSAPAGPSNFTWWEESSKGASAELFFLTVVATAPIEGESGAAELYEALANRIGVHGIQVLQEKVFAAPQLGGALASMRSEVLGRHGIDPDTPFTHAGYEPCVGGDLAGLQITGVRGPIRCETIREAGAPVGRLAEGLGQRALFLTQVRGDAAGRPEGSKGAEGSIERMYRRASELLAGRGFTFRDVSRTWIYLDDLLGDYDALNRVRNDWFVRAGLPSPDGRHVHPASTGVQGTDPLGAQCFMDVVAAAAEDSEPLHEAVSSELQCPATAYGSAFSRGVRLSLWDAQILYLSGTASIDVEGRSRHQGDPAAQIEWSCDVADAVLHAGGSSLSKSATGILYFKDARTYDAWHGRAAVSGAAKLPQMIPVFADVCRPELLFEVEASGFVG